MPFPVGKIKLTRSYLVDIIFIGFADTIKADKTEEKMKRILKIVFCCTVTLTMAIAVLAACSTGIVMGDETLLEGTLNSTEHLSPDSDGESVIFPDPDDETEEITTETPTQKETEVPTETETKEEEKVLKFTSYGNGTCTLSGMGTYTDVYLIIPERSPEGDVVICIDEKAFYENSEIKAVHIPSTVMSIGEKAFGGCTSLVYISVDRKNKSFCDVDGVLYSKDETKLILFPSSSQASEITIPKTVREICDMAFFNSPNLKKISYSGTLQDWSLINIGESNNGLYSASISFATAN